MKPLYTTFLLSCLLFLFVQLSGFAQTIIGNDPRTQVRVYEYYNHASSETIKLFRINSHDYYRSGVSGVVHFVDYAGEGGGMVEFTMPEKILATQKPTLVLHGNAADDLEWYAYQNTENGKNGYDVYVKTPSYHVGLTFIIRGYEYSPSFTVASPAGSLAWSSPSNLESVTFFKGDGTTGIGTLTPDPNYRLSVNGKIKAKEIRVKTGWSDFVFEKDYKLRALQEVESFISENGHLPDVPSAAEVEAEGVNVGEMESILLRKIEELTLYILEQNKQLEKQGREIQELKEQLKVTVK